MAKINLKPDNLNVLSESEQKIWDGQLSVFEQTAKKERKPYSKKPIHFPKGTMVHWSGVTEEKIKSIAENGIISGSIVSGPDASGGTRFCADFFVAKRDEDVKSFYENLQKEYLFKGKKTFFDNRIYEFIPYKKDSIDYTDRVGFVFFPSTDVEKLAWYDCYSKHEGISKIMHSISAAGAGYEDFNTNGHEGVASVLLGLPPNLLGALIIHEEEYEKCIAGESKILKLLNKYFPDVPVITTNNEIVYKPLSAEDIEKKKKRNKVLNIITASNKQKTKEWLDVNKKPTHRL